ncbi:MAG: hypothetical protein V4556_08665 [Bacteroidota bacterium]
MKSFFILLLSLPIASISFAQTTDWKKQQLKGKVKSFKAHQTYRYIKDGAFTPWARSSSTLSLFDNKGRTTEYTDSNTLWSYKVKYAYNEKEKKASISNFDREGKPTTTKEYKYDDNGNKIEEIEYDKEGKQSRHYTYTYDSKGNNTMLINYKTDGTMYSKTTWTYDDLGNATAYKLETPGYATSEQKYTYDNKGNKIEEIWISRGVVDFRLVWTYDEYGNKIKEMKYKKQDTFLDTVTWRYEYDSKGNWTKKTESTSKGEDFSIDERVITYF